jgi:hypothetical protein
MPLSFIYNTIGDIDDVTNGFWLHVIIWFGIELGNLLLFPQTSDEKEHINPTTAQSWQNIKKDFR